MIFVHFQSSYIMSSILVKKPIGFYPISGSNTGYYEVEGGGISRPSEMTDMFDTLSSKCRFRWPSFGDSEMVGGLFGFTGQGAIGLLCAYQPGTDGSSGSVSFLSGSSALFSYTLPSLPVSGSDDEVEYRIGSNKVSLLYHGAEVASGVVSDSAGTITDILGRAFTLGVYTDASTSYYYPGLISSAEMTWLSSTDGRISCVTNYYAAENITDSVWRNTADGVVVVAPALQELPIRAVFYDSSTDKFVKLYPDQITEANPNYTPIGVEVIPAEHDVYGTGQAGIMSLAEMNCDTPDVGSSDYQEMLWSGSNTDTSIPNYDSVNYIGEGTTLNDGVVQGTVSNANLPSDLLSAVAGLDGKSGYYSSSTSYSQAPSPFNADGSRLYIATELSDEVLVYSYPEMELMQRCLVNEACPRGGAHIDMSPDGKYLFTSSRLKEDGIVVFLINQDGLLEKHCYTPTGRHPRHFAISSDGNMLLCANRDEDTIEVFAISDGKPVKQEEYRTEKPVFVIIN